MSTLAEKGTEAVFRLTKGEHFPYQAREERRARVSTSARLERRPRAPRDRKLAGGRG